MEWGRRKVTAISTEELSIDCFRQCVALHEDYLYPQESGSRYDYNDFVNSSVQSVGIAVASEERFR